MRALRVLLATLLAIALASLAAREAAIAWLLRDTTLPRAPSQPPTLAHRGLTCLSRSTPAERERTPWLLHAVFHQPDANAVAGQRRTPHGALREVALVLWLNRHFDDAQLSRLRGDSVWLGRGSHGLEPGARAWFGRPLSELSTAQTALLVGLAQSPTRLDPTRYEDRSRGRRQFVLRSWEACALVPLGTAAALEGTAVLDGVISSRAR